MSNPVAMKKGDIFSKAANLFYIFVIKGTCPENVPEYKGATTAVLLCRKICSSALVLILERDCLFRTMSYGRL